MWWCCGTTPQNASCLCAGWGPCCQALAVVGADQSRPHTRVHRAKVNCQSAGEEGKAMGHVKPTTRQQHWAPQCIWTPLTCISASPHLQHVRPVAQHTVHLDHKAGRFCGSGGGGRRCWAELRVEKAGQASCGMIRHVQLF